MKAMTSQFQLKTGTKLRAKFIRIITSFYIVINVLYDRNENFKLQYKYKKCLALFSSLNNFNEKHIFYTTCSNVIVSCVYCR